MKLGLTSSIALHAIVLAWGVLTLSAPKAYDVADVEALPVSLVPFGDVSHVQVGDRNAPAKHKPAPKPTQQPPVDNQAQHVGDNKRDLKTPPTPKPANHAVESAEKPKAVPPPPVQTAEKPKAALPPLAKPKATAEPKPADTPKPAPPPDVAAKTPPKQDNQPDPVAKAIAAATLNQQAVRLPKDVPTPQLRPTPPKLQTTEQTATKENAALDNKIAALLNHEKSAGGGAERSDQTASLGADTSNGGETLTQSEMDALRAQIEHCWSPPVGVADAKDLKISIKMKLDPDGSLQANPQVIAGGGGTLGEIAAESAMRAVMRCAPYKLPQDKYQAWADIIVNFDPSQMF